MTTFDWAVTNLWSVPEDTDVVVCVGYKVTAHQDGQSVSESKAQPIIRSSGDLIPFNQLNEQTVIGWVKSAVDVQAIEQALCERLQQQGEVIEQKSLPWGA